MVNRDRHDIVIDILKKTASPRNKTELMRDVGLSYLQTKQYLGVLLEKGLLETDNKKRFKASKKGVEFLEKCEECILCNWHPQKPKSSRK